MWKVSARLLFKDFIKVGIYGVILSDPINGDKYGGY